MLLILAKHCCLIILDRVCLAFAHIHTRGLRSHCVSVWILLPLGVCLSVLFSGENRSIRAPSLPGILSQNKDDANNRSFLTGYPSPLCLSSTPPPFPPDMHLIITLEYINRCESATFWSLDQIKRRHTAFVSSTLKYIKIVFIWRLDIEFGCGSKRFKGWANYIFSAPLMLHYKAVCE